jgi:hypothetical protein
MEREMSNACPHLFSLILSISPKIS